MPADPRTKRRGLLPLVVTGITVWLLLVAPALPPDRQLGERDTARLFYPVEKTVAAALRAGRFPLWDPRIESGTSILGQVTPAALHPFALLYVPLPFGLAFKLEHLLALLLGGLGAALLASQLGASGLSALFAAVVFGGCGALVSCASGALPYALGPAAAPLAVAGVLWYLRAPSAGRLLGSGFALALCAYGGDPQSFGIAILVGMVLALLRPERLRRGAHTLLWAACGLMLCAPAAFPAFSQLGRSSRKTGITDVERKMFSAPPVRLLGLAIPLAFDGAEVARGITGDTYSNFIAHQPTAPFLNSICLGIPGLLLAGVALLRRRALPLLAIAAVLVLASTGPAGHVQPILETIIPGWRLFRYTEKHLLHVSWLLATAAALGADEVLIGEHRQARSLVWLGIAAAVPASALVVASVAARETFLQWLMAVGSAHRVVAGQFLDSLRMGTARVAAFAAVFAGIAILRRRRQESKTPAMLAVAAAAASILIAPPLRTVDARLYQGTSATGRKLLELGGPSAGRWRVWADVNKDLALPEEASELNSDEERLVSFREAVWPQLQELEEMDGAALYFSAIDSNYYEVLRHADGSILDLLNIRFYVVRPGPEFPTGTIRSESGFGILQRAPTPRAFVIHRTRVITDLDAAVSHLVSMKVFEEAIVPEGAPLLHGPAAPASVELRRPSPERIEASVVNAAPGLLVISEKYDPGWRAQVDGRDAPVHATDVMVLGVPVPEGRHEIRLRYVPVGFVPGLACAGLTALVLVVLAFRHSPRPYSRIL